MSYSVCHCSSIVHIDLISYSLMTCLVFQTHLELVQDQQATLPVIVENIYFVLLNDVESFDFAQVSYCVNH